MNFGSYKLEYSRSPLNAFEKPNQMTSGYFVVNQYSSPIFNQSYSTHSQSYSRPELDMSNFWGSSGAKKAPRNNIQSSPYVANPFSYQAINLPATAPNSFINQSYAIVDTQSGFNNYNYQSNIQSTYTAVNPADFTINYTPPSNTSESDFSWAKKIQSKYPIGPKTVTSEAHKTFDEALSHHESRGNYKSETNPFGFIGKYQMGEALLFDLGYYNGDSNLYKNDWKGSWSGKHGIKSKQDFLNSPRGQDLAYDEAKKYKWKIIEKKGLDKYIGKTINGVVITPSALLGAAYAQGVGNWNKDNPNKGPRGLQPYLESNGRINSTDGNKLKLSSVIQRYSGFDISDVTG